ncbi:single-stranded DNA-binding protein Ssb [Gottschalkia acidurici 9a]|uniref:Single-stranded DNA-binding protein n=1 Tax=Gottschalkia acidurici (strain ATCC 7906 / DSM 604 / BCRC 14475 / CIP 104303 / KCTC 5404 / NCIMB 10678 / 9a) TaxID=1128398 RepID=K0B4K0_GOTA9|nr:single-stranded DNA-binding protein [Gottschalkia acidurici]AFS79845.1 single-stranded DNA-binding protein Ssb [Gottschalkia acidurici 9a]
MNSATLIGRLTRDPELRYLPNGGTAVCRFSLAVDKDLSREKRQEFESKGQPTADFINIVVWGKQGEHCANYLGKGRLVAIQGRIQTGSYTAADGTKRYTTDVIGERVEFLEWNDSSSRNTNIDSNTRTESDEFIGDGFHPVDEDDIPF